MEHEITNLRPGTWCIEDEGVRFFVLEGEEKAIMIDSGRKTPEAKQIAETLTKKPLQMLCTHADRDHISGNDAFDVVFMHPSEYAFYQHQGVHRHKLSPVVEGDVIDLGNRKLTIIATPGHTPGSIAILDHRERVLISGDPIQRHGRIFMFGLQRSMAGYLYSLRHVLAFQDAFDEIWPSHADLPISCDMVSRLIEDTEAVMRGDIPGKPEDMHGEPIMSYDLGDNILLLDRPSSADD